MSRRAIRLPPVRKGRRLLPIALMACGLVASVAEPARAGPFDPDCYEGNHSVQGQAIYRICMPLFWNGDLVVYAHGYVSPYVPIAIPEDQLNIGGRSVEDIFTSLGYAFAVTSYAQNGLAIAQGVSDVVDLVQVFEASEGDPSRVYLVGVSEGGAVTTLGVERYPLTFDGGLAACGPIGSFVGQVDYVGDFRVLFDYFYPALLPGNAVSIPPELIVNWETSYEPAVRAAVIDPVNATATGQLIKVASVPVDPADSQAVSDAVAHLLWSNVIGFNDAAVKLGGQPFDNSQRLYAGSDNDAALNAAVERFVADPVALQTIAGSYETLGTLSRPLDTLHTTADEAVPYRHEDIYTSKTVAAGTADKRVNFPIERYGHCRFTEAEAVFAFGNLVARVSGHPLDLVERALDTPKALAEYQRLVRTRGVGRTPRLKSRAAAPAHR